jgi:hypothetical protein
LNDFPYVNMVAYPKNPPIRLKGKAYTNLKWLVFNRANGLCERCFAWAPFNDKKGRPPGQLCHIKSRGAGGDDTPENTWWGCWECHAKEHGPRWSKGGTDDT